MGKGPDCPREFRTGGREAVELAAVAKGTFSLKNAAAEKLSRHGEAMSAGGIVL